MLHRRHRLRQWPCHVIIRVPRNKPPGVPGWFIVLLGTGGHPVPGHHGDGPFLSGK